MNTGNGKGGQKNEAGIVNSVIIFRTFDLGEFFKKKNESDIHFLDNRTSRTNSNFQKLFQYNLEPKEQINNCSNAYLQDLFPEENKGDLPFHFSTADKDLDDTAYRTGMVRSNLFDLCLFPKYECNKTNENNLINLLLNSSSCGVNECGVNKILNARKKCFFQKTNDEETLINQLNFYIKAFNALPIAERNRNTESSQNVADKRYSLDLGNNDNLIIKLSISPYGVISVFLELKLKLGHNVAVSVKIKEAQDKLEKLYYLNDCKDDQANGSNQPSLITFISIIAIFDFLYAIRDKKNECDVLKKWFKGAGNIISFNELWKNCTSKNKLPLRHNLSYFYFQHHWYDRSRLTENVDFRKKLNELALFTSYQYGKDDVFDVDIERYKKNELCVTTNGTAQMIDTTLIVAASHADYCVGGQKITEKEYWKGVFGLICFLREYLLLCDRCLGDLRQLRDNYNKIQSSCALIRMLKGCFNLILLLFCKDSNDLIKKNLSSISNLLFDMDEGINRILSSRILFTHDKLKAISINSGLLDLMDNVTRRRRHLENRINETSIQESQKIALGASVGAIIVSIVATLISLYFSVYLSNQEDETEKTNFDRLMQAIGEPKTDVGARKEKPKLLCQLWHWVTESESNSQNTTTQCSESGNQQSTNPDSITSLLKDIKCKLTKHSDQDESCPTTDSTFEEKID